MKLANEVLAILEQEEDFDVFSDLLAWLEENAEAGESTEETLEDGTEATVTPYYLPEEGLPEEFADLVGEVITNEDGSSELEIQPEGDLVLLLEYDEEVEEE